MATRNLSMLVRSLSTSCAHLQLVKPPIQIFGIEGRYATALYSAATKQKTLDAVEKDLNNLESSLNKDPKLYEFIVNPTIKRTAKVEAIKNVASKAGLNAQTGNLLQVLAENGRLKKLKNIIQSYKLIMSAHRGEVVCEVTTAKALDDQQKKQLEGVLKSFLKGNENLNISLKVDPQILGGLVVSIGDRYVDMSVASKVKRYTELISQAV